VTDQPVATDQALTVIDQVAKVVLAVIDQLEAADLTAVITRKKAVLKLF
jgi:hypothetical protein